MNANNAAGTVTGRQGWGTCQLCDTNARKFILDGFHAVMSPLAGWPPEHAGFNVNVDNDESA